MSDLALVGIVVIGRNEGLRLATCFKSIPRECHAVYVDSGSTDGSVALAVKTGIAVVEIPRKTPFTAALARNLGWKALLKIEPNIRYIQFIDGDCEFVDEWLLTAVKFIQLNSAVAVVCGRRRERFPEASVYNQLCDFEWNTPVGQTKACGGDALVLSSSLVKINGYNETLIAGEEPEMCIRIRATGMQIWRIDQDMTLHDAAMTKFSQWWRRSMRAGFAYAQGYALHGGRPELHWRKENLRALGWGLGIPVAMAVGLAMGQLIVVLGGWLLYVTQFARLLHRNRSDGRFGMYRAYFAVIGKFPEALGVLKYLRQEAFGEKSKLIEYK